ncbi:protein-disulfide reductase DsbD family protein [Paracoccus sp. MBLB3053]|uniref:Protein-disulfide reductase DsbD family protein n=1 Tax=Paracoccus aurantius TaxID=3073814 RepID=A0ABU2HRE3_9RHOB|nr:protein-disulfide reductase DsbD domain-containing protein [Paracoccus sp. MBLB3053]MDS9467105.1 protein-disulfide reductase DsbD family protein [Paracoccus sp. MBLB3053]
MKWFAFLLISTIPALAQDGGTMPSELPPGLVSVELLPGWTLPDGHRMVALSVVLEPGWKTYWRSPGDTGVPPQFDWQGSGNLASVAIHWPRPEVIESGGERTLGYHDRLILPIEAVPAQPDQQVELRAVIDFGICEEICVPVQVTLAAPPAHHAPDPAIEAALAETPELSSEKPSCRIDEISDGLRVTAEFKDHEAPEVAMELDDDDVWVSQPELSQAGHVLTAKADFIDGTGRPFPLDAAHLRLTLIGPDSATEFMGCRPVLD